MGKGDIKTGRGKLFNGSYGVKRKRKKASRRFLAPPAEVRESEERQSAAKAKTRKAAKPSVVAKPVEEDISGMNKAVAEEVSISKPEDISPDTKSATTPKKSTAKKPAATKKSPGKESSKTKKADSEETPE